MLSKLRERSQGESGFTLVELLVVMLILGLLAAIAVPAFFNQRDKANDAKAKTVAKTSQTALETYATDNNGSYVGADVGALQAIEPTIPAAPAVALSNITATTYTITATATNTGHTFSISRAGNGAVTYPCATAGQGGCPSGGGGWGS
jgi:type IV pilus assembly protein PilA